jgi:hypothetical protein
MAAPQEIVDSLESVIDVYLSGVRHRERAAFMLADSLVEMACKTKGKQVNRQFNTRLRFHEVLRAHEVNLAPTELGVRIQHRRDLRNELQHQNAAATVDGQYCAAAVMDAAEVIETLWPGTSAEALAAWVHCALRVVRLHSPVGDPALREEFEQCMRRTTWRQRREGVRANAIQIEPGLREYWASTIRRQVGVVEECLNLIGAP